MRPGTKAAIQRAIQAIIRLRDDSTALSPRNEEDQAAIRALTAAERALSWALEIGLFAYWLFGWTNEVFHGERGVGRISAIGALMEAQIQPFVPIWGPGTLKPKDAFHE